jgi:hypothetical protein
VKERDPTTLDPISPPFTRKELQAGKPSRLHTGRWANADVLLHRHGGDLWVVKDFLPCPLLYRVSVGSWMVRRELAALRRLRGLPGTPRDAFQLDRYALAYRFTPGREFGKADRSMLTPEYFVALESVVRGMHGRGIAHLDLRYRGNVLVTDAGQPLILDYQSHVNLRRLPGFLRAFLVNVDLSGVYKHWLRRQPDNLGPERGALLRRMNRWRRLWFLRGYLRFKGKRKLTSAGRGIR